MKAYERVKVEVVKFEAQDVITASVACICTPYDYSLHSRYQDHTRITDNAGNPSAGQHACYAETHPNCVEPTDEVN